jgi:hypothetical protein
MKWTANKETFTTGETTSGAQWAWSVGRGTGLDAVQKKKSVLQQRSERGFPTRKSVSVLVELSVLENEASLNLSEGTVRNCRCSGGATGCSIHPESPHPVGKYGVIPEPPDIRDLHRVSVGVMCLHFRKLSPISQEYIWGTLYYSVSVSF